jgi:TfoX/Sxy family transcriptional regulator of competence genes
MRPPGKGGGVKKLPGVTIGYDMGMLTGFGSGDWQLVARRRFVMSHDPKALQAVLEAAAPPDMELRFKAMFGGIMGYAAEKPFASLSDVGLALKLERTEDHAALMAEPGAKALQYDASQPVSKTYVVVPEGMLGDKDALRAWVVRAVKGLKAKKSK